MLNLRVNPFDSSHGKMYTLVIIMPWLPSNLRGVIEIKRYCVDHHHIHFCMSHDKNCLYSNSHSLCTVLLDWNVMLQSYIEESNNSNGRGKRNKNAAMWEVGQ